MKWGWLCPPHIFIISFISKSRKMKSVFFIVVTLFTLILLVSSDGVFDAQAKEKAEVAEAILASSSPQFYRDITDGTVLTTSNDTVTLSTRLISLWTYNHTFDYTATGAMTIHTVLQENNEATGGQWYEVERDTVAFTGAGTKLVKLDGSILSHANVAQTVNDNTTLAYAKGQRQRMIVDITVNAGGDTLTYDGDWHFKKY